MEHRKLVWILAAAAAFLPALAHADEYDDSIRASFARDLNHESVAAHYSPVLTEADPLDIVDATLRGDAPVAQILAGSVN